jgi:hypothetical protein
MMRKPVPRPTRDRPAQQQRAQDEVAECFVASDELAQPLAREADDGARLAHDRGQEHRLAGEQPELANEAARAMDGDEAAGALDDRHLPLEDHEEVTARVVLW